MTRYPICNAWTISYNKTSPCIQIDNFILYLEHFVYALIKARKFVYLFSIVKEEEASVDTFLRSRGKKRIVFVCKFEGTQLFTYEIYAFM